MRHQHSLRFLKRLNNTDQTLVTSNIKLIKLYKATCRQRGTQIWISVTISTILSTCEESKTDKIIGLIYVWTMMPRVNDFPLPVIEYEKQYLQKWKISIKKNIGVICKKRSERGHILKSQGAAELRMQLIISIYEVLNAKRRHYARVPSLTGSWCFVVELVLWGCRKWFDKLWIVVGRKITEPNYRTRNSSQC